MYIHFEKQSKFISELTNKEIEEIERIGEDKFNESLLYTEGLSPRMTGTLD